MSVFLMKFGNAGTKLIDFCKSPNLFNKYYSAIDTLQFSLCESFEPIHPVFCLLLGKLRQVSSAEA